MRESSRPLRRRRRRHCHRHHNYHCHHHHHHYHHHHHHRHGPDNSVCGHAQVIILTVASYLVVLMENIEAVAQTHTDNRHIEQEMDTLDQHWAH